MRTRAHARWGTRRTALVVALALVVTPLGTPVAAAADCHEQIVVIQVAGSGNGLGPPILFTELLTDGISPAFPASDVEVVQLGAEGHTLGYPAIGFPYSSKWFGLWGTPNDRVHNYNASVDQGASALQYVLAQWYAVSGAGCRPSFVLVGYSQGAQVVREALPYLYRFEPTIAAVVLIADPSFDPSDGSIKFGGRLGPPLASRVGFMNLLGQDSVDLPRWAESRTTSVCVRSDPVCQQYSNRLLSPLAALRLVLSPFHIWGYTSSVLGPPAALVGHQVLYSLGV